MYNPNASRRTFLGVVTLAAFKAVMPVSPHAQGNSVSEATWRYVMGEFLPVQPTEKVYRNLTNLGVIFGSGPELEPPQNYRNIWVASFEDLAQSYLLPNPNKEDRSNPTWSHDDAYLAFVVNKGEQSRVAIYSFDSQSAELVPADTEIVSDKTPIFHPKENELLFVRDTKIGNYSLDGKVVKWYEYPADAIGLRLIRLNNGGDTILLQHNESGEVPASLYSWRIGDSSKGVELPTANIGYGDISWSYFVLGINGISPDVSRIIRPTREHRDFIGLAVLSLQNGGLEMILTEDTGDCLNPAWSRDGKRIAFDCNGVIDPFRMHHKL